MRWLIALLKRLLGLGPKPASPPAPEPKRADPPASAPKPPAPHSDIVATPAPMLDAGDPPPEGPQPVPFAIPCYIAPAGEYPSPDGTSPPMFTIATIHAAAGQPGQIPYDALPADGQVLTADQAHAALYSIILNQFGGEVPQFALPDLRGRAVIGSTGVATPADTVPMLWIMATESVPLFNQAPGIAAGMVVPFAGTAAPEGWVVCDGSIFTQAQYPELFALFGNAFGWMTTTEVALPRLTGGVVIGAGAPYGPGLPPCKVGTTIGGALQGVCLNYLISANGLWPYSAPTGSPIPAQQAFIGQIIAYAGTEPPPGWLLCDGALLAIETYPDLYMMILTAYGGDGELTFATPDLRGKMIVGPSS